MASRSIEKLTNQALYLAKDAKVLGASSPLSLSLDVVCVASCLTTPLPL